jgi:hypothetical protein
MLGYEDAELETNSGWIEGAHPKLVQLDAGIGITEFGRKFSTLDASAKRNDGSDELWSSSSLRYWILQWPFRNSLRSDIEYETRGRDQRCFINVTGAFLSLTALPVDTVIPGLLRPRRAL